MKSVNQQTMSVGRRLCAGLLCGLALLAIVLIFSMNAQSVSSEAKETKGSPQETKRATLGGGCFWCVEAVFETLDGVTSVVSGYAGGKTENPTYQQVCAGNTGHAEVVQIEYDPGKVTYEALLDLFWKAHNPTTLNRQGADVGTQYRSIILYHDQNQKEVAEKSKQDAAAHFDRPIVTEIVPLAHFYPAEEYHQDYFRKNPDAAYCVVVIEPKLKKLKRD